MPALGMSCQAPHGQLGLHRVGGPPGQASCPGPCPRPCPVHAACSPGRPRSRVLGVCPSRQGPVDCCGHHRLLWNDASFADIRRFCERKQGLCFKNKKETTQTVKFQSCMRTSPGVTKQPQNTGFPPPPYPHFQKKGSRVGRWGRAEPNLGIPCLQPIYRRVQKGSQGHVCVPFLHGLIP